MRNQTREKLLCCSSLGGAGDRAADLFTVGPLPATKLNLCRAAFHSCCSCQVLPTSCWCGPSLLLPALQPVPFDLSLGPSNVTTHTAERDETDWRQRPAAGVSSPSSRLQFLELNRGTRHVHCTVHSSPSSAALCYPASSPPALPLSATAHPSHCSDASDLHPSCSVAVTLLVALSLPRSSRVS